MSPRSLLSLPDALLRYECLEAMHLVIGVSMSGRSVEPPPPRRRLFHRLLIVRASVQ